MKFIISNSFISLTLWAVLNLITFQKLASMGEPLFYVLPSVGIISGSMLGIALVVLISFRAGYAACMTRYAR